VTRAGGDGCRYHGMLAACEPQPSSCPGDEFVERNFNWTLSPSDRVKLWIDNQLIIDQWTSLASLSATASHRFLERAASLDFAALFQVSACMLLVQIQHSSRYVV
jgi:hypothetical protein